MVLIKPMPFQHYLISFKHGISTSELPEHFTFPFYYTPHPLCMLAAKELQEYLLSNASELTIQSSKLNNGKMFGVLLVKNDLNKIGYLAAYSGKSTTLDNLDKFVPAVSNAYELEQLFKDEQQHINQLTKKIESLESNTKIQDYQTQVTQLTIEFTASLTEKQLSNTQRRKQRKEERVLATLELNDEPLNHALNNLAKQSVGDKNEVLELKKTWQEKIQHIENKLTDLNNAISQLKNERQQRSTTLQKKLFEQYNFLNSEGNTKSLTDIFKPTPQNVPPAGAGDCAAPKLLQYAFKHNLIPIAMAEFWWGETPKSEIRQHKNYYPACIGKCEPILNWMLKGMVIDENPLLKSTTNGKDIDILFQDDAMAIINKPSGYLSVPGKHINASVQTRIKELIPTASGPIIVHRLDMCTSGLMVIALTKRAHKALQKQFINRTVNKRYIALLDGVVEEKSGEITLPLIGDYYNRPSQIVCEENGKSAHTTWEVIEHTSTNKTKVYLIPKTGRTHQLRVHSAHYLGLNTPIVGDDLYGKSADRLHLHAEKIELDHPITKTRMTFQSSPKF